MQTPELHLIGCVTTLVRANSYLSQLATGSGNRSYCATRERRTNELNANLRVIEGAVEQLETSKLLSVIVQFIMPPQKNT